VKTGTAIVDKESLKNILNKSYDFFFYVVPFLNFINFNNDIDFGIDLEDPEFRENLLNIISKCKDCNNSKIEKIKEKLSNEDFNLINTDFINNSDINL
ncbi:MAG: hypothetical protein ACP5UN_03715, partial [Candidatus Micrarchaeia archaeon]